MLREALPHHQRENAPKKIRRNKKAGGPTLGEDGHALLTAGEATRTQKIEKGKGYHFGMVGKKRDQCVRGETCERKTRGKGGRKLWGGGGEAFQFSQTGEQETMISLINKKRSKKKASLNGNKK